MGLLGDAKFGIRRIEQDMSPDQFATKWPAIQSTGPSHGLLIRLVHQRARTRLLSTKTFVVFITLITKSCTRVMISLASRSL